MRVDCTILTCMHLDPGYALLSVQNCLACLETFNILDVHRIGKLNDVQFTLLLKNITNLTQYDSEEVFSLLDVDNSGEIEFEEFYLFFCILVANKDSYEKEFIYRHATTIFQLIDADASGEITANEFNRMGIFFNFDRSAIKSIFTEFDVSGDKNLDFGEFKLFTMACIDEARAQDTREKVKAFKNYRARLLTALEPILRRFVRTDRLPRPREVEHVVNHVRAPYIPGRRDILRHFKYFSIGKTFFHARKEIRRYFKRFRHIPCFFCCCGYLLCCYFCTVDEDPEEETAWRTCNCKCRCRCMSCWAMFLGKLWTCCNCAFPCCHCCLQPSAGSYQHVARHKEKVKYPDKSTYEEKPPGDDGSDQLVPEESSLSLSRIKSKLMLF